MRAVEPSQQRDDFVAARAEHLFERHRQEIFQRTDRLFAGLLVFQWLAGIAVAQWISPRTWAGQYSELHLHVWAAVILGGSIVSLPAALAVFRPGRAATRHIIAIGQMLMGALLIHLTGGRIETHFHVFGSLAFLTFCRDWRVLVTASIVVALDHFLRGLYWPQTIFGVLTASPWRWLEHAGWVVFEDLFLIRACSQSVQEMCVIARRQAEVEGTNSRIEREVAERTAQLKASENRIRAIFDSAADSIISIDVRGQIDSFNPAAERLFGYMAAELAGRNINMLMPSPYQEQHDGFLANYLRTGVKKVIGIGREAAGRRKAGSTFALDLDVSEFEINGSRMFLGIVRDITLRKEMQARMLAARDAAESASRAKSEFLANMSHEIRTPMNGILGMTSLALQTELTAEQQEYLGAVKTSGEALLTVLNDILDFSKIEAGKLDLEAAAFSLQDTLGGLLKTIALRAHDKGLELACHVPADVPDVLVGDPVRLRQVLLNLIGNALKFTEQGEVVVSAMLEARTHDEATLHFTVRDTGIGIPAGKQQAIFEAFTQADGSTTRKYGGTGLGLSISSQLVGMMGGRIWVESEEGRGSTFHFTVRLGVSSDPAIRRPLSPPPRLRDMPALVVDDNATNRRILKDMLLNWQMKPVLADSGAAALAALEEAAAANRPFGLILLDGQMPEMDGFRLAELIQQRGQFRRPAIIMLTSANQRGDAARCRELGIAVCLVKPAGQTELLAGIIRALRIPVLDQGQTEVVNPNGVEPIGKRLTILLAEDNLVNQKVALRLLEKQGHRVVVACNGKEGLAALERERFDLVLMDVQMPEMDGFEATAAVREQEKAAGGHLPIVAMTAHAMKGDRERCLAAGMDGYVSKPIQWDELQQVMQRVLNSAAEQSAALAGEVTAPLAFGRGTLLNQFGGDEEMMAEIVTLFLAECPRQLAEIRDAVGSKDAGSVWRAAHIFKGAAGCLGAVQVAEAAHKLESMGESNDLGRAAEALESLMAMVQELTRILAGVVKPFTQSPECFEGYFYEDLDR